MDREQFQKQSPGACGLLEVGKRGKRQSWSRTVRKRRTKRPKVESITRW